MRKLLSLSIVFFCLSMLCSCSFKSSLMTPSPSEQPLGLAENESRIIFYRSSSLGAGVQAPIVEYENNDVVFCGIASYGTKFHYIVNAGKHEFIVGGESASMLKADIEPNKNYYVKIIPMMGMWKARFCFEPMSQNQLHEEKNRKEILSCVLVAPNESSKNWFNEHRDSMLDKSNIARQKFEKVKDKDRSKYMLSKDDCIDELL